MEYQISWEIFMNEEQTALKKAIELGATDFLTHCIIEMTPQKEAELQKLKNQMAPVALENESDVMKKYTIERLREGKDPSPQSPQEEAALQKLLDEEQLERQKKFSVQTEKQAAGLESMVKPKFKKIETNI